MSVLFLDTIEARRSSPRQSGNVDTVSLNHDIRPRAALPRNVPLANLNFKGAALRKVSEFEMIHTLAVINHNSVSG